jgi:hypothetical protein
MNKQQKPPGTCSLQVNGPAEAILSGRILRLNEGRECPEEGTLQAATSESSIIFIKIRCIQLPG